MSMRVKNYLFGMFLFLAISMVWADARSAPGAGKSVMFFPTLAVEQPDGSFMVDVEAWVFAFEKRTVLSAALARYLNVDLDAMPSGQRALFGERTRYFRTDSERGEQLRLRLAGQVFSLPHTDAAGRTGAQRNVRRESVEWLENGTGRSTGRIPYALEAPGHAAHAQTGYAWVIPDEGVSIVSDIDDTIKISNVLDKKILMRNTFLEPFQAVPGMAAWYQEMARNEPRAFFHYLSAAPLQLYPALEEFLRTQQFPAGILHLRESTRWRSMYGSSRTTITHKTRVLKRLLSTWPRRRFILIGDSGENDPEIYAEFARSDPDRILAIHIRDVTGERQDAPRYQKIFADIDPRITIRILSP